MKPGTLNLKLFLSLFLCTQRLKLKENKKQVSELGHIWLDLVTRTSHTDLRSENLGSGREFAVTGACNRCRICYGLFELILAFR